MPTPRSRTRSAVPDARAAVELARVDLVRGYRWLRGQDFWLLYSAVSAVGFAFIALFAYALGHDTGLALAAGETPWFAAGGAATAWSVVWLFTVAMLVADAVGSNGDLDHDGHYLTLRPAADVAGGKVASAAVKFAGFVFLPVLALYVGLSLGTGTPTPLVGGVAAAVLTVASATAVGYPVGLGLKGAIRRSAVLTRLKPILGVGVGLAYFAVMLTGEFTTVVETLRPVLRAPPLGWLADLSLVTTPGVTPATTGVVGAVLLCVAVTVAGVLLTVPAARYAWRTDRTVTTEDGDEDVETTAPDHAIDRVLAWVTRAPATRGVASTALLRVYRSPLQLVFVAFPLLAAIPVGEQVLASGTVPWYAPWLAVWYGAWAAGAALPLNPLGNQGSALPPLLTSPADGRHVVHGHVLAAAVVAVPVTGTAAGLLADAAGYAPVEVLGVVLAAVGAVLAASVLAAGLGSLFPRFEAVDFAGSRRAVPPSKVAYGAFSTVLTATVVAGAAVQHDFAREVVSVLASRVLPFGWTVDAGGVETAAWVVLVAVTVALPVAYRVAVRRLRAYRLS
jgi:ABC-2 type transport system permease protein